MAWAIWGRARVDHDEEWSRDLHRGLQPARKRLQPARKRLQPARKKEKLQPARKQFQPVGKNLGDGTQDAHCASWLFFILQITESAEISELKDEKARMHNVVR